MAMPLWGGGGGGKGGPLWKKQILKILKNGLNDLAISGGSFGILKAFIDHF